MRPRTAGFLITALYVLHQDFWFWREARPLVFGFLPIGLFYHAAFTATCALVLWLLVTVAWPEHLEGVTPDLKVGPTSPFDLKVEPTSPFDLKVGPTPRQ